MAIPIRILSPVWGEKHLELFENALCRSLKWPKNRDAVQNVDWVFITDSQAMLKRCAILARDVAPHAKVEGLISEDLGKPNINNGHVLLKGVLQVIEKCLLDKLPLLMATPDFIFGNGTIQAFKEAGLTAGTCVSIPNMRVLPRVLTELTNQAPSNAELVSIGLKHPHAAWTNSQRGVDPGMTFGGGVSWFDLDKNVIGVRHWLPSPFYVNFLKEDLDYFKSDKTEYPHHFMLWDHAWPSKLIDGGRVRYIGSSDGALMIEVTEEQDNVPPWNPKDKTNNDEYFKTSLHNIVQKQFIYTLRSQ